MLAAGVIAGLCYLGSDRDEAVRAVVFVASMKGIDHKKALRVVFYVTLTGMAVLAMLSLAGVLGVRFGTPALAMESKKAAGDFVLASATAMRLRL